VSTFGTCMPAYRGNTRRVWGGGQPESYAELGNSAYMGNTHGDGELDSLKATPGWGTWPKWGAPCREGFWHREELKWLRKLPLL
jgi:hypothetical protein